jgi:simple sugar transport system permease protein
VNRVSWALGAVVLGLGMLVAGLYLTGYDAAAALAALWTGAFGSWYAFTSATLVRAVPLILIGLGIAIAFRGGAFNIGAEGQFYAGAIAATWIGIHLSTQPAWLAIPVLLVGSVVAGAAWVAVPVWLKLRFGVIEVISTLLLNFVGESLVSLLVQGPLQEPSGFQCSKEAGCTPGFSWRWPLHSSSGICSSAPFGGFGSGPWAQVRVRLK